MIQNVSISRKIVLQAVICILVVLLMFGVNLFSLRETLIHEREAGVKQVSEAAASVAAYYQQLAQSGAMSDADARTAAGSVLRAMHFGQGGYIYVYGDDGTILYHGARKELEGQNRIDAKDPSGVQYVRDQIATAKNGGGFTYFSFTKPGGGDKYYPKISYDKRFAPWGWTVGNGVYVDDIDNTFSQNAITVGLIIGVIVIVMLLMNRIVGRSISVPIISLTNVMRELAAGNLNVDVPNTGRKDEIGGMAEAVQIFKANGVEVRRLEREQDEERRAKEQRAAAVAVLVRNFEAKTVSLVQSLSGNSAELKGTAQNMSAAAYEATSQATSVTAAARQATANVETVAASAEQLLSSISVISQRVEESARIATTASEETTRANARIQGLATAADRIGEVVKLINDIASQTDLLALNATIEAARAGDAGKGFAVVANEVKNLANQTGRATDEIGRQISAVQEETRRAVEAINGISAVINQVREISSGIATAVEEQGGATREIARSAEQAANGTSEVSRNIGGVTKAAETTRDSAGNVLTAAGALAHDSETLREEVTRFLSDVRSA
jgi:methyl-accepting chemotaxis protein